MDRTVKNLVRRSMCLAQCRKIPKDLSAVKIRSSFLEYFCENNQHLHVRSCPVFSLRDPTLAFVNAGMNQFKNIFLGLQHPPSPRVANSQKCIRVGGKHNDLDVIGTDGYHHTFFEMLGNWSFGDYFKKEACNMSWEMLTKVYGIPPERLYVTYFGGEKSLGLEPDFEVKEIWREIGVQESHILPFGMNENFWEAGVIGPCGPCTEIHYDHCPGRTDAGKIVNSGSSDLTELWNLVFTQFDRKTDGSLKNLNTHFVDTGMGFERLVAVLQGKTSNYDTDLFLPLFDTIRKYTGHEEYKGKFDGNAVDCAYRILADHSRMIAVALSDGVLPSNSAKLKKIIKKALLVSEKIFRSDSGLLKELTNHVAESLSDAYPEIGVNLNKIHYIIESEENFTKAQKQSALAKWKKISRSYPGLKSMNASETPQLIEGVEYIKKNILEKGRSVISEEDIWIMLNTLGIPVEVSRELSLNLGLQLKADDFEKYESSLKSEAKEVMQKKLLESQSEMPYLNVLTVLEGMREEPSLDYFKHDYRTDSEGKYIFKPQSTTVKAIVFKDEVLRKISGKDIQVGEEVGLLLDRTQLFSEESGQASDFGTLTIENDTVFDINKVVNVKGYAIHFGTFRELHRDSEIRNGNVGVIKVDEERRLKIMQNHTALHLLNAALRSAFIGVEKTSEVQPEKLRLTFNIYKKKLDKINDIEALEKYVNDFILHGVYVKRRVFTQFEFQKLHDVVFVPGDFILDAEIPVVEINSGFKLSKEYCKGAHVLNTSEIKDFVITKHSQGKHSAHSFEAVTGDEASRVRETDSRLFKKWTSLQESIFDSGEPTFAQVCELSSRVNSFQSEDLNNVSSLVVQWKLKTKIQEATVELKHLKNKSIRSLLTEKLNEAAETSVEKFVVHRLDVHPECLTEFGAVFDKSVSKPFLLFAKSNDHVTVFSFVPEEFVSDEFNARKWIESSVKCGGIGYFAKGENPDVLYRLKERKFTEEQLSECMETAAEFARRNIINEAISNVQKVT